MSNGHRWSFFETQKTCRGFFVLPCCMKNPPSLFLFVTKQFSVSMKIIRYRSRYIHYTKGWPRFHIPCQQTAPIIPKSYLKPRPPPRLLALERRELPQIVARALIAPGVLVQVKLVIRLGVPPLAGGQHLGDDLALGPPLVPDGRRHAARHSLLLRVVVEDAAAVLAASVRALRVRRRRVVHAVEELEQFAVRQLRRIVVHLQGFGV